LIRRFIIFFLAHYPNRSVFVRNVPSPCLNAHSILIWASCRPIASIRRTKSKPPENDLHLLDHDGTIMVFSSLTSRRRATGGRVWKREKYFAHSKSGAPDMAFPVNQNRPLLLGVNRYQPSWSNWCSPAILRRFRPGAPFFTSAGRLFIAPFKAHAKAQVPGRRLGLWRRDLWGDQAHTPILHRALSRSLRRFIESRLLQLHHDTLTLR